MPVKRRSNASLDATTLGVIAFLLVISWPYPNGHIALIPLLALYAGGVALIALWAGAASLTPWHAPLASLGRRLRPLLAAGAYPLTGAALFFCLAYGFSGLLFQHLPVALDSMAQYAGAKIFAQGHLTLPSHPHPRFFDARWFINDGQFYTFYPPGHMALLALGHLLHNPAIVNPLLGSLSLLATYFLAREIGGVYAAYLSIPLFLCSPFILFLSSEFDNRATALLMATLLTLFFIRTMKYRHWRDALLAGMAMGYLCLTRPQTALPYGLPFALYGLLHCRAYWKHGLVMLNAAIPFLLFFLWYNFQTTGNLFLSGYEKYFGTRVLPGAHLENALSLQGLWGDFTRMASYAQLLHQSMFGWPVSSLTFAFLLFLCHAQKRFCGLLAAVIACCVLALFFSPYTGVIFGPRYLYETSSLIVVLTAVGLQRLPALFRKRLHLAIPLPAWRALLFISLSVLIACAWSGYAQRLIEMYGHNYRVANPGWYARILNHVQTPALVLVRDWKEYRHVVFTLPPDDRAPVIFARYRPNVHDIMAHYPDRHIYAVQGDAIEQLR